MEFHPATQNNFSGGSQSEGHYKADPYHPCDDSRSPVKPLNMGRTRSPGHTVSSQDAQNQNISSPDSDLDSTDSAALGASQEHVAYSRYYPATPTQYHHQPVTPQHHSAYQDSGAMDFTMKKDTAINYDGHHLGHPGETHEDHHTPVVSVVGGMVAAQLDSEGSSVKSYSSDSGSCVSSDAAPQMAPPSPGGELNESSQSYTGSDDDNQSDSASNNETPLEVEDSDHLKTMYDDKNGQRKARTYSPNLTKIEAVINNLRTAKAKKQEKKELKMEVVDPSGIPSQTSQSDPHNLWAMYAMSQYAMMAPGSGSANPYYPYYPLDGAAASMYGGYQSMAAQAAMMGYQGNNFSEAMNSSHDNSKKRKQEEEMNLSRYKQFSHSEQEAESFDGNPKKRHNSCAEQPLDLCVGVRGSPLRRNQSPQSSLSPSRHGGATVNVDRLDSHGFMRTHRSPPSKASNREEKTRMLADHTDLWGELKRLAISSPDVKTLLDDYQKSVDDFETERYQALLDNISSDQCKEAVHAYFNQERSTLVKRVRAELDAIKSKQLEAETSNCSPVPLGSVPSHMTPQQMAPFSHSATSPFSHVSAPNLTPTAYRGAYASYPYASALYGLANAVPVLPPNFGVNSPSAAYMTKGIADDAAVMCGQNDEENDNNAKRKFLNQDAVNVLQAWYDQNQDHPYPDDETVDDLAKQANINSSQVKKWMANKRVRSSNTLAFNGSIHPKKIQKLIQLKEIAESMPPPQPQPLMTSSPAQAAKATSGKKNKRLLDPRAVEFMTQWYNDHIMYPYPTEEEKLQIADSCALSVSQVTCWFANKRNRSHHSRKNSMLMQKYAEKMTVYDSIKQEGYDQAVSPVAGATLPISAS